MMPTDSLPEEAISETLMPDEVFLSQSSHFVTAWWMPPRPSENAAQQAQAFAEVRTEVHVSKCVNDWSID